MRKIPLIASAGLLAVAVPAIALTSSITSTATPNKAGKASTLHFAIDGLPTPVSGRIPLTLRLKTPPGFRVNLQAVAKYCSKESAALNECPAASRFGKGLILVGVTTMTAGSPTQVRTVHIPLTMYLHSSTSILALAKVFGWQVVPATLSAGHGLVVRFDPLPQGPPFQGVTYAFKQITLDFGASRMTSPHGGSSVKKTRVNLITNPPACSGRWATSVLLTFKVGPAAQLPTSITCSKS